MNEPWFPRRSETRPSKTPHLRVRTPEGLLGEAVAIAVAITGNRQRERPFQRPTPTPSAGSLLLLDALL